MSAAPAESEPENVPLPDVGFDPIPSLGPYPIEIDVLDTTLTVPALPAARWLEVFWGEDVDLAKVFPGFLDEEDHDMIMDALVDGDIDGTALDDLALELLEASAGLRWWFVVKLCSSVKAAWLSLGGKLVLAGVDPWRLSLGSWCSAVLTVIGEHTQPKHYSQLLLDLSTAPEGYGPSQEELLEMDEQAFMAAMSAPF